MNKILVIDIGGSSMKFGLIDENLNITEKGTHDISKDSLESFTDDVMEVYQKFIGLDGVAFSQAGTVDTDSTYVYNGGVFPFLEGKSFREIFEGKIAEPIAVANDAVCATLAELEYGNLSGSKNAMAIILGSAIGSCFVIDGKIATGHNHFAGQASLVMTDLDHPNISNAWMFVSGKSGLSNEIKNARENDEELNGIEIFELANAGDEKTLKGLDHYCSKLAVLLFDLQTILDAEKIVIGGGISAQPLLLDLINKQMDQIFASIEKYSLPVRKPEILACKYHNDANLIGAYVNFERNH